MNRCLKIRYLLWLTNLNQSPEPLPSPICALPYKSLILVKILPKYSNQNPTKLLTLHHSPRDFWSSWPGFNELLGRLSQNHLQPYFLLVNFHPLTPTLFLDCKFFQPPSLSPCQNQVFLAIFNKCHYFFL